MRIIYPVSAKSMNPVTAITKRNNLIPKKFKANPTSKTTIANNPVTG